MPDDPIAEYCALLEALRRCTHCRGSGKVRYYHGDFDTCPTCHGNGARQSQGVISPDVTAILEALPRLVDVAEAAREHVAFGGGHDTFKALRAALSKLRKA